MVLQQLQMYVSVLRLQAMNLEHHKLQLCLAQACVNRAGHVKSSTSGHHECQSMSKMPKQLVKSTSESIAMYCSIGRQTNSHTDARFWHASCVLRNSYYVIFPSCTKHDINVQKQNEVLYMVSVQSSHRTKDKKESFSCDCDDLETLQINKKEVWRCMGVWEQMRMAICEEQMVLFVC